MESVAHSIEAQSLHGANVLLVEDDADTRELLEAYLSSLGATCFVAGSGNAGFDEFRRLRPDVVVSDLWMPDGDGFDLIRRIRALSPDEGGLTPAIAVSAGSNTEQALMAGYHALVAKPYDPERLVDVLGQFLDADEDTPSTEPAWSVTTPAPGLVVLTFVGYTRGADMRAATAALVAHLDEGPCDVVVDYRRLTGFSLAVASIAERAVWSRRAMIRHVRILGGPLAARLVAAGACRVLGLKYAIESAPARA